MKTWAKSRPAPRLAEKACAAVIAARGAARSRVISLQSSEHAMEEVEYVATGNVAVRGGEAGDIRIGSGECGGAQIEARWEALDAAANDALRVAGLDLASTATASSLNGPSAVNTWVMLPKASSCWSSRQSVETSMRQRATYWPSWLRGVNSSIWITLVAGVS